MPDFPETFDQAARLLRQKPLPADIVKQLDELKAKTPEKFHRMFGSFYESAHVIQTPIEGD